MDILEKKTGGSQTILRQRNIVLVLRTINDYGPASKKEIVRLTGLSFAKVNSLIISLSKSGIIRENGKEESIGGRRSSLFELNPDFKYVVGCQLSHTEIQTVICTLKGKVVSSDIKEYEKSAGKEVVIESVLASIENIMNTSGIPRNKFLGVGVAIAGLINPKDGTALPFPHLVKWGNVSFKTIIMEKFKLPCYVHNVANAAALAELKFGVGKGKSNLLYLNVGSGLGMGIVLNGKLYEGISGSAGEFGHITVDEHGPLCECGNVGCLEAIASTTAIVKNAKHLLNQGVNSILSDLVNNDYEKINFQHICQAAEQGDKLAFNLIDKMGENLGEGIVTLINLMNPETIILGGRIVRVQKLIINPITNIIQKRALEIPRREVEIVFSEMDGVAGAIGAIIPVLEKLLDNPLQK